MSVGTNIQRLRNAAGMTQGDLANKLGVARSTVTQWENGWSNPRMGMVQKLAGVFGVTTADIVYEVGSTDAHPNSIPFRASSAMVPVRVLGRTHAGDRMDEDECAYEAEFPRSVVERHPGCFALTVEGDCMSRRFNDGDHILVDPNMEPRNGSAVVAEFADGRSVVRSYLRGSSTLVLAPDSHTGGHEDIVVTQGDDPVRLVGVVFWNQAGGESD